MRQSIYTDKTDDRIFHIPSEIILTDYEKEQLVNWEFQGAEYYVHMKKAEEKNTLETRVCTLGDRYVLTDPTVFFLSDIVHFIFKKYL